MLRRVLTYLTILAMLANTGRATLIATYIGMAAFSKIVYSQSTTPVLDELKTKHNIDNAQRNHTSDTLPPRVSAILANPPPSKSQTANIADALAFSATPKDLELTTRFPQTSSFAEQTDLAISLGSTHGQPSGTVVGNQLTQLDVEYSRSGTRKFVRDPVTGVMKLETIEGVDRVSGIQDVDLYSQELNNTNYGFEQNKQAMYGNDQAIFDEGKVTNDSFKDSTTGQTGAARGYRVITSSALTANNTVISEHAPWLQPSFDAMTNAEDGDNWLASCTNTTVTNNNTYNYQTSTEYGCQDTSQSKLDYCQVERIYREPLSAASGGLTSCGPGCFELKVGDTTNNFYDPPGHCGVFPNTKMVTINLSDGITLDRVTVQGYVDDHVEFTVNGNLVYSVITGVPSNTAPLPGPTWPGCESGYDRGTDKRGRWHFSGDQTAAFSQYILPDTNDTYVLGWNVLVGGRGEINASIRFYFSDSEGANFKSRYVQTPDGCYDAISGEQKAANPLDGMYQGDMTLPPVSYTCTSSSRQINCPIGSIPVGVGDEATCHNKALESLVCPVGTLNPENGRCETLGDYYCDLRLAGDLNCNGNRVISPESQLNGDRCIISDFEHCGGAWSQVIPATLNCPDGLSDVNGVCTGEPNVETHCADGSDPLFTDHNGQTVQYCFDDTVAGGTFTIQDWSCTGGRDLIDSNCIITRGNPDDTATCFEEPIDPDYVHPVSFCTFDGYSIVEEGDRGFSSTSLASVPPFFTGDTGNKTWIVNLDGYRCDPTQGKFFCRTDPDTLVETCMTWEELRNLPNECKPYIEDPTCSEISRTCTPGWIEPQTGRCMADDVVFECTQEHAVDYDTQNTTNVCNGMLPCSGGECEIGTPEANTSFIDAMVAGSIVDNLQGDTSCTDPMDPSTCEIFPGEFEYCSWEVTGLGTDCCEEAKGVDVLSYIILTRQILEVNQYAAAGAFGDAAATVSNTLSQPITDGYQAISSWVSDGITSISENMFGNADGVANGVSALSDGIEAALSAVQQAAFELIYDIAPDALRDFLFDNAAEYAADSTVDLVMNEAIAETLSTIFAVYTVYNLTKLALTLLTACDDSEIDMSVKLAQRQCFKVGTSFCSKDVFGVCYQKRQNHCCYSSILGRIIMNEAYKQFSINPLPYGNNPTKGIQQEESCPGMTPAELAQLDFDTPSMQNALQEWTGLLLAAEVIPTQTNELLLTGGATTEDRTDCPLEQIPRMSCFINANGDNVCEQARDINGQLLYDTQPSDCGGRVTGGRIYNAGDRDVVSERIAGPDGYIGTAADRAEESQMFIRQLPGAVDCAIDPTIPLCRFGFDPTDG